jgi:CrcB protein
MLTVRLFLICLGGAVGSGARYLTAVWAVSAFGTKFPAGTVIVNVVGSFLIAIVMQFATSHDLRLFLATGLLGGFTTYSAFNEETLMLVRSGATSTALLNVGVTLVACFVAGLAGFAVARAFVR